MSDKGMIKAGDTVVNPSVKHIERGLVKEAKVLKPEATKTEKKEDKKTSKK